MGMLLSECHVGKSIPFSFQSQQPGWDLPIPSTSAIFLEDITGHGAAERPV